MYYGFKNKDEYNPLCLMEYKEFNKHYQVLYYNKNYKQYIFFDIKDKNFSKIFVIIISNFPKKLFNTIKKA